MKTPFLPFLSAAAVVTISLHSYLMTGAQPAFAAAAPAPDSASKSMLSEIDAYEKKFFERSFAGETSSRRLDRLETFIFGATSTGSVPARIAKIAQVVPMTNAPPAKTFTPPGASLAQPSAPAAEPVLESPGNYPHITALEAKILGETYPTQALTERLARLETKAFGAPSKSKDLEERTDAIDRHEQALRAPKSMIIGTRPDDNDDDLNVGASTTPRHFQYAEPPPKRPRFESADEDPGAVVRHQAIEEELEDAQKTTPPTKEERTLSRIAWCEQQVFGHAYPEMHLLKRLHQLNHELFPNDQEKDIELMDRIDTIVKEVVLRKQPHQPATT